MATQAMLIAETIAGMKRAVARKDDESESDDSIHRPTNRGNKLKRKAQYVHEGQLDLPNGPKVYRRKIEHAGYTRFIINKNPARVDKDGDELDNEDIDEYSELVNPDDNPFQTIRLEHILRPLVSAAELPDHPSLSIPYLSTALTTTVDQVGGIVRREKAVLWKLKQLLTKFRGDDTWQPCGIFETESDIELFGSAISELAGSQAVPLQLNGKVSISETEQSGGAKSDHTAQPFDDPSAEGTIQDAAQLLRNSPVDEIAAQDVGEDVNADDVAMVDAPTDISSTAGLSNGHKRTQNLEATVKNEDDGVDGTPIISVMSNGNTPDLNTAIEHSTDIEHAQKVNSTSDPSKEIEDSAKKPLPDLPLSYADEDEEEEEADGDEAEDSQPAPHRMTTRAQAQAASDNTTTARTRSQSPEISDNAFIHPLFLAPESALPDRDFGLQPAEAEDIRRLLLLYVQKQEQVCRNLEKLHNDLMRADLMRKTVYRWAKAEGHVGEMSDGEDWYDKEEWGLDEDLKKGHDEDEDDGTQGKKTRGRRN